MAQMANLQWQAEACPTLYGRTMTGVRQKLNFCAGGIEHAHLAGVPAGLQFGQRHAELQRHRLGFRVQALGDLERRGFEGLHLAAIEAHGGHQRLGGRRRRARRPPGRRTCPGPCGTRASRWESASGRPAISGIRCQQLLVLLGAGYRAVQVLALAAQHHGADRQAASVRW